MTFSDVQVVLRRCLQGYNKMTNTKMIQTIVKLLKPETKQELNSKQTVSNI